jgi:hypothetical protein
MYSTAGRDRSTPVRHVQIARRIDDPRAAAPPHADLQHARGARQREDQRRTAARAHAPRLLIGIRRQHQSPAATAGPATGYSDERNVKDRRGDGGTLDEVVTHALLIDRGDAAARIAIASAGNAHRSVTPPPMK